MNAIRNLEIQSGKGRIKIKKDLRFKSTNPAIKRVDVGFFPSVGRYFRKEMEYLGDGNFELEVNLPRGKAFLHYFFNGNFDQPMNTGQSLLTEHDSAKRSPLILETEMFCPVYFKNEPGFISHIKDNTWEIRVITYHGWVNNVSVLMSSAEYPMQVAYSNKNTAFWTLRVELAAGEILYCLKFSGNSQLKYLHENSIIKDNPDPGCFFRHTGKKNNAGLVPLRAGYQIFPDRFCRSGKDGDVAGLEKWGNTPGNNNFFGGNLQGITSKLDYIAGLGVDFIYLNPIFKANSNHRYDCVDYMQIDPMLGTRDDFSVLVKKAHERSIKVILDISFNHCSTEFFAFKDIMKKGERSIYCNWFEIDKFPVNGKEECFYSCWHGLKNLPQFNLDEPEVEKYLVNAAQYWVKEFDIDGWRLDVCTEMPSSFIRKISQKVKHIKPSALIIGESWQNDVTEYTKGGVDGITNFSFYLDAMVPFFVHESIPVKKLALSIMTMNSLNSFSTNRVSWNFLGNHDTPRFYSLIKNKQKYLLAFSLMYALPGTPVVYYGEEIRLQGLGDPGNRGCMPQEEFEKNDVTAQTIASLNAVKRAYEEILLYGTLSFTSTDDASRLMVIERTFKKQSLYFAFNFDCIAHPFQLPFAFDDELSGYSLSIFFYDGESGQHKLEFTSPVS
jgi:glycosidase